MVKNSFSDVLEIFKIMQAVQIIIDIKRNVSNILYLEYSICRETKIFIFCILNFLLFYIEIYKSELLVTNRKSFFMAKSHLIKS